MLTYDEWMPVSGYYFTAGTFKADFKMYQFHGIKHYVGTTMVKYIYDLMGTMCKNVEHSSIEAMLHAVLPYDSYAKQYCILVI